MKVLPPCFALLASSKTLVAHCVKQDAGLKASVSPSRPLLMSLFYCHIFKMHYSIKCFLNERWIFLKNKQIILKEKMIQKEDSLISAGSQRTDKHAKQEIALFQNLSFLITFASSRWLM